MNMNGINPTRRRPHAASPSLGSCNGMANGSNDNEHHAIGQDDGGQGKTRRKRFTVCSVLPRRIRWPDLLLIFACWAKPAHMLYQHFASTIGTVGNNFRSSDPIFTWIETWKRQKMPFNSPYMPDQYIRVFRGKHNSPQKSEHGNGSFRANRSRERTHWALRESEIKPQNKRDDGVITKMHDSLHSINLTDEPNQYIDDSGEWDQYYAFDDDYIRSAQGTGLNIRRPTEDWKDGLCIRPTFYKEYYPTCNEIHSSVSGSQWMLGDDSLVRNWAIRSKNPRNAPLSRYLASGYYRDAFVLEHVFGLGRDEAVFKSMKQLGGNSDGLSDKYVYTALMEDMRKDSMVMELLTSSPRAANIYSFCAMSSVIEFTPGNIEGYILQRRGAMSGEDGSPANDHISPFNKLEIALEMAKCIAAMHGFEDGPIAHVDVQPGQFFRGSDGLIKLVDYNRAEALLYDVKQDKYCGFVNGLPPDGMLRAPEENVNAALSEKIDVYSLGNVFYSVLTGMTVFQNNYGDARRRIVEGITEPIADFYYNDPSLTALAEAIKMCWTYDVEERPSIFEIVLFLEKAVKANIQP